MAHVHHAAEELGRPIRLEKGLAEPSAAVDLVLVGVDDVRLRLLVQETDAFEQRVRVELVVVIEEGDELTVGRGERLIGRGADSLVRLTEEDVDRPVAGEAAQVFECRLVRRAVVGEAELPVRIGLTPDGLDRAREPLRVGVVDGRDDRDERTGVQPSRLRGPQLRRGSVRGAGDHARDLPTTKSPQDMADPARLALRRAERRRDPPRG